MAEFQTVMREFQRLCSKRECGSCPVGNRVFNERASYCCVWVKNYPEEAESIIMQWAKENPFKTNRDKFREVFGMDLVITGNTNEWLDQEYKENNEQIKI